MQKPLRIGTRGSKLARAQTTWVCETLAAKQIPTEIVVIESTGDRDTATKLYAFSSRGVFVKELEEALLQNRIDVAVHSLKDVPTILQKGLSLAAIPKRENEADVLLVRPGSGHVLADLPSGAVLGTSSLRRRALLSSSRPDLQFVDLRGNIDTRLRRLHEGEYDAICLAAAGLIRLKLDIHIGEWLSCADFVPAPGQGALALECRAEDEHIAALVKGLHCPITALVVNTERRIMSLLEAGCAYPLGVWALPQGENLSVHVFMLYEKKGLIIREKYMFPLVESDPALRVYKHLQEKYSI